MKEDKEKRIKEIEDAMAGADFWHDKEKAQAEIKVLQELKTTVEGGSPYDAGDAVITIFSGAGGIDKGFDGCSAGTGGKDKPGGHDIPGRFGPGFSGAKNWPEYIPDTIERWQMRGCRRREHDQRRPALRSPGQDTC